MANNNSIGYKILTQSLSKSNVQASFNEIKSMIAKEVGKTNKEIDQAFDNLDFSNDLVKRIVSEFEKAEKELGTKSLTFSKDLFKGLIDANGAEEEINKVVKIYENKIESLVNLRNRIGDDKIFVSIDTTQLDELIEKEQRIIELRQEIKRLSNEGKSISGKTKSINTQEKKLNAEIEAIKKNLRSFNTGGTGQINVPTINEKDLKLLDKYNKSIDTVKRKMQELYTAIDKGTATNKDYKDYIGFYQQYERLMSESGQPINDDYKRYYNDFLASDNNLKKFAEHLKEIFNLQQQINKNSGGADLDTKINTGIDSKEVETIKNKISELENQISEMQTKLQNLDGEAFTKMKGDIDNLETQLGKTNTQVSSLQDNFKTINDNSFTELKNNVNNLLNKFDELNNKLHEFVSLSSNSGTVLPNINTKGSQVTGKVFHGSKTKWDGDSFDFSKSARTRGQLGAGMYFTADAEKVANFGKAEIKELEVSLDNCFVITKEYITSISDLYKAIGKEIPDNATIKEAMNEMRMYNNASQENAQSFRKNMIDMGYQGMYVGDNLANKLIPDELVVYDEKKLENLKSFTNNEFQELKTSGNIEIKINDTNIDEVSRDIDNITKNTSTEGQNRLQSELNETQQELQEVGTKAQEAMKKVEALGKVDVNPDISPEKLKSDGKDNLQSEQSFTPETPDPTNDLTTEQKTLEKLEQAIRAVTTAIAEKIKAIQAEEVQMDLSINNEIAKLKELESKLTEIKTQFQNGILSGFKNPDGGDNVVLEKDVNLKPTYDADKFKKNAETLLAFVDVDKEVELKIKGLDSDSIKNATADTSASDNIIEEQNKDIEHQEFLYNNIIRLLTEYLSLQDKISAGNRRIIQSSNRTSGYENISDLVNSSDIRRKQGTNNRATTKSSIQRELKNYLDLLNNDSINTKQIDRAKEELAAYVYSYKDLEGAAEIFGEKNKEVFNEIVQMIEKAKVSLKSYEDAQMSLRAARNNIFDLSDRDSMTFGQVDQFEGILKTEGVESALKYVTDELGFKIPEAADKAKAALNEVDAEIKDVKDGEKKNTNNLLGIKLEPEINEGEWIQHINDIIASINQRKAINKVQIQPDTSSNEWNEFKTFIKTISDQVIKLNLQMNEDGSVTKKKSTTLPSDLNDSYKNSTKYVTELYKVEEKIAQAKENNNKEELENLATLEAEKKKYEELLRLEEQFRTNERFNDFDTDSKDNALNKLRSTKEQEYQANRNVAASSLASQMASIEDEAWKANEAYNQNKKLEDANRLLDLQREKWQEINNIRIKMESESGFDDDQIDLDVLEQQKKALMEEVELIQEQLKQYDSLIDKEKEAKKLGTITADANKTINGGRVVDLDKAYNEANKINEALIKTENMMNRFANGVNRNDSLFGEAFVNAKNDIGEFNRQLESGKIDLTQYNRLVNDLKKNLSIQKDAVAIVNPEDISNMDQIRNILENYMNEATNGTAENLKWNDSARTLTATFKNQNGEIQNVTTAIKDLNNGTSAVTTSFGKAQKPVSTWSKLLTELGAKFRNLTTYLATFVGFYEIWAAIRQGVTYVRELDTALTEMRKVSDETVGTLREFQEASFDIADSVGATAQVVQNSTAEWMRLGESLEQAAESAQVSNILLNVSEFESIDDATESLVAMSQAYNEFDKIDIVDKLNNIGNNYSIATDGIAEALQRSASSLTTAGNTLDEAIALVTAGNSVVQDPESVGAGLRTISLRLVGTEQANKELEELGEEAVTITQSKMRDVIMAATKVESNDFQGFDILDENGNYKSTYEILQGISDLYDEIVETDKEFGTNNLNLLLENLAGKNRSNIAASILQNGELLRSVYESSQDSEGSAQEELDAYLDSIEGRITKLTNSVQRFWSTFIDTDVVKDVISLLTNLMDLLTNIVDTLGSIGTVATAIIGGFAIKASAKGGGRAKIFMILRKLIIHRMFNL